MNMRIGGLASGMDIDSMVSELMSAQRTRLNTIEQDQQIAEWKQENYQEVNRTIANFIVNTKTAFGLAQSTSTGSISNVSVDNLTWVKSANISDSDLADVTAYAAAEQGSYYVNVTQLATNWSCASSAAISAGDTDDLVTQFGIDASDTINFTITTNSGSVTINETDLDGVSISDIVTDINEANIGVTAIYDSDLDRFFLQTDNTGEENTVEITDSSVFAGGGTFITGAGNKLKLQYLDASHVAHDVADSVSYTGENALLDFGAATGISQSSNSFTINNIRFDLKETGDASINVNTNVSAVYEKVSQFVTSYNSLMETIGTELTEQRYSDYRPLTDEQRDSLTDTQIDQWEIKAKSGLIKSDTLVTRVFQSVRSGMYQEVEDAIGSYDQLVEIGITTQGYSSGSMGGQLAIDEADLREAIETDVDSVLELFFKEPSTDLQIKSESQMTSEEITQKRSESGLINRLYDNLAAGIKDIVIKAGYGDDAELLRKVNTSILLDFAVDYGGVSMLDDDIEDYEDRIDDLSDYLTTVEDRYWRQFSAMEQALQQLNQQSAWLTQQLSSTSA